MPLEHKGSEKAFKHNVRAEMHAGKALPQSLAIAYAVKRRGRKMARGGEAKKYYHGSPEKGVNTAVRAPALKGGMSDAGLKTRIAEEVKGHGVHPEAKAEAHEAHRKTLAELRSMPNPKLKGLAEGGEAKPTGSPSSRPAEDPEQYEQTLANGVRNIKQALGYAEGGRIEGNYQNPDPYEDNEDYDVYPQESGYVTPPLAREKCNYSAEEENDRSLNQHGEYERGPYGAYAHGGSVEDYQDPEGMDMVDRVMKRREQTYSEGGQAANDTGSPYDDLVNRDEFEYTYTGKTSGDELGNEYDSNHDDLVARAMLRRKKQHNPNPA